MRRHESRLHCSMLKPGSQRVVEILLIEDNRAEARLAEEALSEAEVPHHLSTVCDGLDAMDFLHQRGKYSDAPRPGLVLLDLNMPRMDGREVLQAMKTDENLKRIPVVVLTTSQSKDDILN